MTAQTSPSLAKASAIPKSDSHKVSLWQWISIQAFEIAVAYLWFTVLPMGSTAERLRQSSIAQGQSGHSWCITLHQYYYLPLIGITKGVLAFGAGYGMAQIWHPAVAYGLASLLYSVLSGAIHADGYMDTVDSLFASHSKDPYEVMRDPHVGALAVAQYLFIFTAFTALTAQWFYWIGTGHLNWWFLITPFLLSKLNCFWVLGRFYDLFKKDQHMQIEPEYSWWSGRIQHTSTRLMLLAVLLTLWPLTSGLYREAYTALALLLLAAWAINSFWIRRLRMRFNFLNGDCLGFLIILQEVSFIFVLSLLFVRSA